MLLETYGKHGSGGLTNVLEEFAVLVWLVIPVFQLLCTMKTNTSGFIAPITTFEATVRLDSGAVF